MNKIQLIDYRKKHLINEASYRNITNIDNTYWGRRYIKYGEFYSKKVCDTVELQKFYWNLYIEQKEYWTLYFREKYCYPERMFDKHGLIFEKYKDKLLENFLEENDVHYVLSIIPWMLKPIVDNMYQKIYYKKNGC